MQLKNMRFFGEKQQEEQLGCHLGGSVSDSKDLLLLMLKSATSLQPSTQDDKLPCFALSSLILSGYMNIINKIAISGLTVGLFLSLCHNSSAQPGKTFSGDDLNRMLGAQPILQKQKPATADEKEKPADVANTRKDIKLYNRAGHKSKKWDELIAPAFESFDSGNLATSLVFMQKAYDKGCRDSLLLFRLALYRETTGALAKAADLMKIAAEKLPKQYPSHPLAHEVDAHAARTLYKVDRTDDALVHINKAIARTPNDFMLLFMGGQILRQKKENGKALLLLMKANSMPIPPDMDKNFTRKTLLNELVAITYELGEYESSSAYINEVFKIYPNDPTARHYMQLIAREKNRSKQHEILKQMVQ